MRALGFILVAMLVLWRPAHGQPPDAVRVEEGVPGTVREALNRVVPNLLRLYATLLDAAPRDTPVVSVAWHNRGEGERGVQAQRVAGGGVHVVLSGRVLADPPPDAVASHHDAVAHELALLWNSAICCRKVGYMAGRDLMREPLEAVRDAKAACARDRTLVFRTLDEREFRMPCDDAIAAALPSDLRVANLQPLRVARVLLRR